jgi:hypothetical protein
MASDDNGTEQITGRHYFRPLGWKPRDTSSSESPQDRSAPEPSCEPFPDPMSLPEDEAEHARLMDEVGLRLREVAADAEQARGPAQATVDWFVSHPHAIRMFLSGGHWSLLRGDLARFRGSVWIARPTLSSRRVEVNRRAAYDALLLLINALSRKEDSPGEATAEQRSAARDALYQAYDDGLWTNYRRDDSNPVYAWEAYAAARRLGRPIPQWVLSYLDRCSDAVSTLAARPPAQSAAEIPKAFEFANKEAKRGAPLARAALHRRDERIFDFLHMRRTAKGGWPKGVLDAASGKFRKDEIQLRKIYAKVLADRADFPRS